MGSAWPPQRVITVVWNRKNLDATWAWYDTSFFRTGDRIRVGPAAATPAPQREGIVTTGRFSLTPVSAIVNSCISCVNDRLERRSPSSIQNQVLR